MMRAARCQGRAHTANGAADFLETGRSREEKRATALSLAHRSRRDPGSAFHVFAVSASVTVTYSSNPIILDGLDELLLRIHNKRTVTGDRLLDPLTAEHEQGRLDPGVEGDSLAGLVKSRQIRLLHWLDPLTETAPRSTKTAELNPAGTVISARCPAFRRTS